MTGHRDSTSHCYVLKLIPVNLWNLKILYNTEMNGRENVKWSQCMRDVGCMWKVLRKKTKEQTQLLLPHACYGASRV